MRQILFIITFLVFSLVGSVKAQPDLNTNPSFIPITVTVRSINDLRVKEGQKIKIGQLLALKPVEPQAGPRYISKNHDREVEKQKAKLERVKQIVKEEGLPEIVIKHEEAKLRDLEFAAKEYKLGAIDPKAPQETTYLSPVNGIIKRITPAKGSDGRLNIEILVEQIN